ncbi:MAG: penicillin-binding protein, partial [Lachnospiraceae bacterium]|nr:penicillin-binding protein [Lachnospiraceae bacterium]
PEASPAEQEVYNAFLKKKDDVLERLTNELMEKHTPYNKLSTEYKVYENRVEDILLSKGILVDSKIDKEDETYKAWYKDETISLYDYLNYAISQSWINIDALELDTDYSESGEIFDAMVRIVTDVLQTDILFEKQMFKYIVKNDNVKPRVICQCLLDQNVVVLSDEERASWDAGKISAYDFMIRRIENLEITPAQLALEPYAASMVITDVNTGKVKALVSYPSYDNNYIANGADSAYLAKITNDLSMPLFNYATQQRTAPGSTYKMVSSTAGLVEGVISLNTLITCTGSFTVATDTHKCWVWPGSHGALNVTGAINKSCNSFFYNVGYRLSLDENGIYNSELGVNKLNKYADWYGLCDKSGVEIEEYSPNPTTKFSVPSAIGQGTNSFTTVGLARYVTALANRGTVYNLTLLDKITDSDANVLVECKAEVKNEIEMKDSYWDAIQEGMRRVVADTAYFKELPFEAAGKTGTAQQSTSHPDHALFISYAPYNDPQYSIAIRIANGYTSSYPSHVAKDAYKYIFNVGDKNDTITGTATDIEVSGAHGD